MTHPTDMFADAMARIDATFKRGEPVRQSTPAQMAAAREAAGHRTAEIHPTAETVAYINSQVCMDYNAKRRAQGAEAVRIGEKIAKARRFAAAAATFSKHRLAEAMHHIATERRDHLFQVTTWGHDSGLTIRREALGQYLATLRMQARRSRQEAKAAA